MTKAERMQERLESLMQLYKDKLKRANESNDHAIALKHEGAVGILDTLLIYADQDAHEEKKGSTGS